MPSTCQELAPIIALVPIDEFRRLGVVPTYFDPQSKRLKLICSTTMDDSSRSELSSRLPDVDIEWHLADEKVFEFMYQRIAGNYPPEALPRENKAPETPAKEGDGSSENIEPSMQADQSEQAIPAAESHETGQFANTDEPATTEPEAISDDISRSMVMDGSADAEPEAEPRGAEPPVDTRKKTSASPDSEPKPEKDSIVPPGRKTVLFVSPTGSISQHLVSALNAERYEAITVSDFEEAIVELDRREVACIFAHENLHEQKLQFVRKIQATRPEIPIRFYVSDASILLNDTRDIATSDLIRQNLTLFSRLHDSQGSAIADHAASVAKIADRIAARLAIPLHYRFLIVTAAFMHNMAEENLKSTEGLQPTDIIGHSASRLESWGFPSPVVRLLRRMYSAAKKDIPVSDRIEAAGGYILTTADVFCRLWPDYSNAAHQVDSVRTKLEDQLRGTSVPSVIDALVDMVREDSAARMLRPNTFSVHIFEAGGAKSEKLTKALEEANFGVSFSTTITGCAQGCAENRSEALIIRSSASVEEVYDTLMTLAIHGLALNQLQILLLLNEDVVTDALRLLSHGVEEILPATAPARAVVTKLARMRSRLEEQSRHKVVSSTERQGPHGSLNDMTLVNLIETFRDDRKPTKISVTAHGNQLMVYLDNGKIVAADCGDAEGMAAFLKGISWRQGVWNVDSIDASGLPKPNIDQSIDTVLIAARKKLGETEKDDPVFDLTP